MITGRTVDQFVEFFRVVHTAIYGTLILKFTIEMLRRRSARNTLRTKTANGLYRIKRSLVINMYLLSTAFTGDRCIRLQKHFCLKRVWMVFEKGNFG